jgi:hypothetical protein
MDHEFGNRTPDDAYNCFPLPCQVNMRARALALDELTGA